MRPHLLIETPIATEERTYPGGGGGGTYPRTSYEQHAQQVYAEAQAFTAALASQNDSVSTQRRYYRVQLPDQESVWASPGVKVAEALHSTLVGAHNRNVGHLSTTSASVQLILDELRRYADPGNIGKSKFSVIEELGRIPASEKLAVRVTHLLHEPQREATVLLSLFPDLSHIERQAVIQTLGAWLAARGGVVTSTTEVESGVYIRVTAKSQHIREIADTFLTVQSVDPVDYALDFSSTSGPSVANSVLVLPNNSSAIAAIFDGGIVSGSRFLDGSIVAREEPLGPPFNPDHGTVVASRIIYGDTLHDQVAQGRLTPDVKVLSICTSTADHLGNIRRISTDELMRIVRDTVARWHTQIRVYNISQNLFPQNVTADPSVADDVVSPLAAELDQLARRYHVLFVLTTGNYPRPSAPPPTTPYPDHFVADDTRIVPPAEAMLALTVGSIAERANSGSLAPLGLPSPFTRRGPGFASFRKPDVVAHGGNYGANWQQTDDLAIVGIGSYGDRLSYGCGTSYAAPLITRLAAQLFAEIPDAAPELVRALLIHFATRPESAVIPDIDRLVGNGRPDPKSLLQSSQWVQGFVHQGKIPHREIRRVGFYVPQALTGRSGRSRARVRVSMAYSPETQRTLKAGYCKSHVRCKIRKCSPGGSLSDVPISPNASTTIVKDRYAGLVRLEKTFSANIDGGEWELVMEHESRWSLQDNELPVAAVITVEDPREDPGVDILAAIRTEVPNRYQTQLATAVILKV